MRSLMTFALMMILAGTAFAQTANVQVIHNSPDPGAASVDIYLDAGMDPAIPDFGFREATGVLELPAEVEIVIGVAPGNSSGPGDIIANFPVTLMEGGNYLVVATGVLDGSLPANPDGEDTAFTLAIFDDLMTSSPAGTTDLLVYHGSPDAPTVDVQVMDGPILIDDLTYGFFQGYLNAAASDLVIEVTLGNDNENVVKAYDAPLSALDGSAAVIFASGFLSGDDMMLPAFGLFVALPSGDVLQLHETSVATEQTTWTGVRSMFE